MSKQISIIVGSVLGATEYVAEALKEVLDEKGYNSALYLEPDFDDISQDSHWLVCSSTHGAGDLPDNIQSFAKRLESEDLSGLNATIIGLGDTSYDTYCFGAIALEDKLKASGANITHPPLHIDVLQHPIPEDVAVEWLKDKF
ncbi:FMN-binding protein MioC [Alteromonas sediminis]|uniref:FMN-binding protein MioC n=1 Tax=Alteromonas sediminis TaxID=2259342 RepID=A0A3N5ZAZ8_9ALTE|nr:FMN-binding protein MioC [Alteromonas sediminis]RPJ66768.1 FMN-binding protein MioC [Alteromonas sediminis]